MDKDQDIHVRLKSLGSLAGGHRFDPDTLGLRVCPRRHESV